MPLTTSVCECMERKSAVRHIKLQRRLIQQDCFRTMEKPTMSESVSQSAKPGPGPARTVTLQVAGEESGKRVAEQHRTAASHPRTFKSAESVRLLFEHLLAFSARRCFTDRAGRRSLTRFDLPLERDGTHRQR